VEADQQLILQGTLKLKPRAISLLEKVKQTCSPEEITLFHKTLAAFKRKEYIQGFM
jgi:hypothetical protein